MKSGKTYMVHTAFCDADEVNRKYEAMKAELQAFADAAIEDSQKRCEFFAQFTSKY